MTAIVEKSSNQLWIATELKGKLKTCSYQLMPMTKDKNQSDSDNADEVKKFLTKLERGRHDRFVYNPLLISMIAALFNGTANLDLESLNLYSSLSRKASDN